VSAQSAAERSRASDPAPAASRRLPVREVRLLPGKRLPWALVLPLLVLPWAPELAWLSALASLMLLAAAWAEGRALGVLAPEVERRLPPRLAVSQSSPVVLRLTSRARRALQLSLRDDVPLELGAEPKTLVHAMPARGRHELGYSLTPMRRGDFELGDVHVRVEGLLQLGAATVTYAARSPLRVYPNLRQTARFELAARAGTLHGLGVRAARALGGSGELEQLREYVPGDAQRDLDWKATAKRRRPITRVYGQERAQTVLVALDAGRMMASAHGEPPTPTTARALDADDDTPAPDQDALTVRTTKLDHALHAALLLAHVALRGGDRVGALVFADDVRVFVPPRRGPRQYLRILDALATVQPSDAYVDFRRMAELLRARVPRRSLLVVFSDLLDDTQALPLAEHAGLLAKKHLPVCVTLNDPVADALGHARARGVDDVHRRAAAAVLLEDRAAVKARLRKAGVALVEADASGLAVATVNRYLAIKARRAL
jgi:uncharacterized protein (DUF58 family)